MNQPTTIVSLQNYVVKYVPALIGQFGSKFEEAHYEVFHVPTGNMVMTPKWYRGGYATVEEALEACDVHAKILQDHEKALKDQQKDQSTN